MGYALWTNIKNEAANQPILNVRIDDEQGVPGIKSDFKSQVQVWEAAAEILMISAKENHRCFLTAGN